ncbi:hypothetical protein Poli38472_014372 [Pythium oligandrum]|uniref:Ankyrin repeat protein n=1 Tax=Pythium oligandrum TaxID=41045 RepID=A0A8K1C795_PYTOL|nr:hypothetical protein Poli38472_014372 [Pythium oligandrum]|eukprot:TMW57769.1 hypothetical protein Poli38472_014372 [Pythium oligandrum]
MAQRHDNALAACVLTQRPLFLHVTSFMDGLPGVVMAFARKNATHWGRGPTRSMLPCLAIIVDDMEMLTMLYGLYEQARGSYHGRVMLDPRLDFQDAMYFAATRGFLSALQWLDAHTRVACSPHTLRHAATMGRLEAVQWLAEHRKDAWADITVEQCDGVVLTGSVDLVRYLLTRFRGLVLTTDAMDYAASQGHLAIVRLLHEYRSEGCTTDAMDHAARCGLLAIVRFLHENRHEGCTQMAMDYAAANGHLDVVQFLHEHRHEGCTTNAMDEAAKNGHLDVVQYLHRHRQEGCTTYAMDMAAWHNRLDVVQFLATHRREGFTPMAMGRCAQLGYLDVIRFLHEHQDGEWNCHEDTLQEAARYNHLDVVEYLVQNCTKGCLFTARKCAEERECHEVIAFLTRLMRPGLTTCSIRHHTHEDSSRRCQKQTE